MSNSGMGTEIQNAPSKFWKVLIRGYVTARGRATTGCRQEVDPHEAPLMQTNFGYDLQEPHMCFLVSDPGRPEVSILPNV